MDSGKSNNLVIFHYLGYRNMMSTDVTAANIYQYLGNLMKDKELYVKMKQTTLMKIQIK